MNPTIAACAEHYGVTVEAMRGPRRSKALAAARHAASYILSRRDGMGSARIGRLLGGRDHSTILHGIAKVAKSLAEFGDSAITELIECEMALGPQPFPWLVVQPRKQGPMDPAALSCKHKAKNAPAVGDTDGLARLRGDARFLAALRVAHPERCVG